MVKEIMSQVKEKRLLGKKNNHIDEHKVVCANEHVHFYMASAEQT